MLNPSKREEYVNSPVERASELNNPQFENNQGYFPFNLTHQEFISPRFGEITPCMNLDTVPGDRVVLKQDTKLILNQINSNFLSTVNQYQDSFFVSLRNVFPNNFEKLIVNPVKGEDIPNTALPQVPILAYLREFYRSSVPVSYLLDEEEQIMPSLYDMSETILDSGSVSALANEYFWYYLGRLVMLSTIISRGQLLDYLGYTLDSGSLRIRKASRLQECIDNFWNSLYSQLDNFIGISDGSETTIRATVLDLQRDVVDLYDNGAKLYTVKDLSTFRSAVSDILESGAFPIFGDIDASEVSDEFNTALVDLIVTLDGILLDYTVSNVTEHLDELNLEAEPFADGSCINIGKVLAYQLVVAQYFTNDRVDNIYNSDLYLQNLRSVMYPTPRESIRTIEPVFDFNGVSMEYDYISYGGFWSSLLTNELVEGSTNRQFVYASLMFLMRRSLRYGDYFATARPNMLAVSDELSINVEDGQVSPIDVTKNLLLQRYLNAVNYVGQGFLQYMGSIFGVRPSDTGVVPRFISHRKINIQSQITNNTADNQGAQSTNLIGISEQGAMDVFCDDFGYLITLTSFDVLPVYKSGQDGSWHFGDRFDYFNPMMQNIGDQAIRLTELVSNPSLYDKTFGYTMRNAEYKYKISRAHGAFVNGLPQYIISYPTDQYVTLRADDLHINPEFIRDKPSILDVIVSRMTGISPAEYYHFIVSVVNECHTARKIQATPSVLF